MLLNKPGVCKPARVFHVKAWLTIGDSIGTYRYIVCATVYLAYTVSGNSSLYSVSKLVLFIVSLIL